MTPAPRSWRRIAATAWTPSAAGSVHGAGLARLLRTTWRLPSWAPQTSVRHELSSLLPNQPSLTRLVRALHGRLIVANQAPVAALSRAEVALVRGLVDAAGAGLPSAPWPVAERGASATWPPDSQRAHAAVLAHAWLAVHDPRATVAAAHRAGRGVTVALYEGPPTIALTEGGVIGAEHGPAVRDLIVRRLPPRTIGLPHIVATIPYRLVVVAADASDATGMRRMLETQVPAALLAGSALGAAAPPLLWFVGNLLLPDAAVVAAMDGPARQRWAAFTGRAGAADAYWYPDSWRRFLEPDRVLGHVTAASVARSTPTGLVGPATVFSPAVERGVCVPPAYALVDCVGTLGIEIVVG